MRWGKGGEAFQEKALSSLPPHPHPSSHKDFRLVGRPRERSPSPRQESGLKGALWGKCPPQCPPFQSSSAGRRYLARPISASAATRRWCGREICCPYGAPQGAVNRARRSLGERNAWGKGGEAFLEKALPSLPPSLLSQRLSTAGEATRKESVPATGEWLERRFIGKISSTAPALSRLICRAAMPCPSYIGFCGDTLIERKRNMLFIWRATRNCVQG